MGFPFSNQKRREQYIIGSADIAPTLPDCDSYGITFVLEDQRGEQSNYRISDVEKFCQMMNVQYGADLVGRSVVGITYPGEIQPSQISPMETFLTRELWKVVPGTDIEFRGGWKMVEEGKIKAGSLGGRLWSYAPQEDTYISITRWPSQSAFLRSGSRNFSRRVREVNPQTLKRLDLDTFVQAYSPSRFIVKEDLWIQR